MAVQPLPISVDSSGPFANIAVVKLEQPVGGGKPVVVLDRELIERLEHTLNNLPPNLIGLVLASASDRVFVAGADLKSISELSDDALHRYLEYGTMVFQMLADLPFPTAAAINGAALGGGLELAMHCDALIGAPPALRDGQPGKPYPIGLPEAGLSICPGWGGTCLLPARMDPAEAITRTATGKPMLFDEASAAGLFDAVAPSAEKLLDTAKGWVRAMATNAGGNGGKPAHASRDGAPSRHAGRHSVAARVVDALDRVRLELPRTGSATAVCEAVDAGVTRGWAQACQIERDRLVHLRNTPEGKAAIQAFFAKAK
jgi:enoyl-CoA hydratase/carnithine racemase